MATDACNDKQTTARLMPTTGEQALHKPNRLNKSQHTAAESKGDLMGAGRNALLGDSLIPITGLGAVGKRMLGGRCVDGMLGEPSKWVESM